MSEENNETEEREQVPMTMKEQLEALLEENYNKYPDAIDWMMSVYARTSALPQSRYEKFMEQLNGNAEFANMIYDPIRHNIVQLIKEYRQQHNVGLKQAKERIEWYIANNYYDCLPRERQIAYGFHRDVT